MSTYQRGFGVAETPGITYEDLVNQYDLKPGTLPRGQVDPLQANLRGLASDPFIKALNLKRTEAKESGLDPESITRLTQPPRQADAVQAPTRNTSIDRKDSMYYAGIYAAVSEEVTTRLAIAERASSLDLPDHAVYILQKAFDYVESNMQQVQTDVEGENPKPIAVSLLNQLKQMKNAVVNKIQSVISSHGGPHLSKEEINAMMTRENGGSPKAGQSVKPGETDEKKAERKQERNIKSAAGKIAGAIPEILNGVVQDLDALQKNKDATAATAWNIVYNALTKLDLAQALMRIAMVGGSLAKQVASEEAGLGDQQDSHKDSIENLEKAAYKVYHAIKRREVEGNSTQLSGLQERPESEQEIKLPQVSGASQTKGPAPSRAFLQVMRPFETASFQMTPYQMDYLKNTSSYSSANRGNGLGMAMLGNATWLDLNKTEKESIRPGRAVL